MPLPNCACDSSSGASSVGGAACTASAPREAASGSSGAVSSRIWSSRDAGAACLSARAPIATPRAASVCEALSRPRKRLVTAAKDPARGGGKVARPAHLNLFVLIAVLNRCCPGTQASGRTVAWANDRHALRVLTHRHMSMCAVCAHAPRCVPKDQGACRT